MTMAGTARRPTVAQPATPVFSRRKFIAALDAVNMEPQELADAANISIEAIARWMAGIASPRPVYADTVAAVLGIDVDDLYS